MMPTQRLGRGRRQVTCASGDYDVSAAAAARGAVALRRRGDLHDCGGIGEPDTDADGGAYSHLVA